MLLGYDPQKDEIIYHESTSQNGAGHKMPRDKFLSLWPLKYDQDKWTVVRIRLDAKTKPRVAHSDARSPADYAQHVLKLRKKLPSGEFSIVVQPPFVVIGDESEAMVKRRAASTVAWATEKLKSQYFRRDPLHILDVWLFKDKASYDEHNVQLFGRQPTTPFGYYSPTHRALVMNIATGRGTLVHEVVHPFIESNFPNCPAWFNEGLGSLYEQSASRDKQIVGLTNWRLAGLQRAIEAGRVPSFETLCSTTTRKFYDEDRGTNYAQARYLCYYLQERDLLNKYYHDFVKNSRQDPTGYETLKKTLGTTDMARFQEDWSSFVMRLKFG